MLKTCKFLLALFSLSGIIVTPDVLKAADVYARKGIFNDIQFRSENPDAVSHWNFPPAPFFEKYDDGIGLGSIAYFDFGNYDHDRLRQVLPEHILKQIPEGQSGHIFLNIQSNTALANQKIQLKCHSYADPEMQHGNNQRDVEFWMKLGFWGQEGSNIFSHNRHLLKNGSLFQPSVESIDFNDSLLKLGAGAWELSAGGYADPVENTSPAPGEAIRLTRTLPPNDKSFYFYKTTLSTEAVAGKPLTLSFWVRSSRAGTLRTCMWTPEDNQTYHVTPYYIHSPHNWQRIVVSIPACNEYRGDDVHFYLAESMSELLDADEHWVEFAGVKLEATSGARCEPEHWYMWSGGHAESVARGDIPGMGAAMRFVQDKTEGTTFYSVNQIVKGGLQKIAGRPVTFSCWVKAKNAGELRVILRRDAANDDFDMYTYQTAQNEDWVRIEHTFPAANHNHFDEGDITFYLCEGLHGLLRNKDDWVEFAGVQLEVGEEATPSMELTLGETLFNPDSLYETKQTIHGDGRLSSDHLSVIRKDNVGLKPAHIAEDFSGISLVRLKPGEGFRGNAEDSVAITYHVVCNPERLYPAGQLANPQNLICQMLGHVGAGARRDNLLAHIRDEDNIPAVELSFADFRNILFRAGMLNANLKKLFDNRLGVDHEIERDYLPHRMQVAAVVNHDPGLAVVQPNPLVQVVAPVNHDDIDPPDHGVLPPEHGVQVAVPNDRPYPVAERQLRDIRISAGRRNHQYWLTSGEHPPEETPSKHDDAPYLDVYDNNSGQSNVARTIALIDCGVFSAEQLQGLRLNEQPEIAAMIQGLAACKVVIHAQELPLQRSFSRVELAPGNCLGAGPCRIQVGFHAIHYPFATAIGHSRSEGHQLSAPFVYKPGGCALQTLFDDCWF